ncbi:transposase [Streptomyces platensis]|uniref:transposase n=1 Tax=Streptomyces platensis TaxID=58346 RepID=UPI0034044BAB
MTDAQWAWSEPLLPDRTPKRGGRWRDHRQVADAIAWKLQTGSRPGWPPTPPRGRRADALPCRIPASTSGEPGGERLLVIILHRDHGQGRISYGVSIQWTTKGIWPCAVEQSPLPPCLP